MLFPPTLLFFFLLRGEHKRRDPVPVALLAILGGSLVMPLGFIETFLLQGFESLSSWMGKSDSDNNMLVNPLFNIVVVALPEEIGKLLLLRGWLRKSTLLSSLTRAMRGGLAFGVGFAMIEHLAYLVRYLGDTGLLFRGVLATSLHIITFTILAYGCASSRLKGAKRVFFAFFVSWGFHAIYNLFSVSGQALLFLIPLIPMIAGGLLVVRWLWSRAKRQDRNAFSPRSLDRESEESL